MMKTYMLGACAAAVAAALSGHALAQAPTDPVLQARIAVSWNAPVQGLAKVLAERLTLPYLDDSGAALATVVLDQGESATVAQAMETINKQIESAHLTLRLSQGSQGQRLELAKTQPDSMVAAVTVGAPAPASVSVSAAANTETQTPSRQSLAATPTSSSSSSSSSALSASPAPLEQWEITPADATLRNSLRKWTEKVGWQLLWEAGSDVPIPVKATFEGDFRAAVLALFDTLSASEVALNGVLYRGNKVLRVVEAGHRTE